jgi:hypothetical protein
MLGDWGELGVCKIPPKGRALQWFWDPAEIRPRQTLLLTPAIKSSEASPGAAS